MVLSRVWLFATPRTVAYQALLSTGFPRQVFWNKLLFPTYRGFPDPWIERTSLASLHWQRDTLHHAAWEDSISFIHQWIASFLLASYTAKNSVSSWKVSLTFILQLQLTLNFSLSGTNLKFDELGFCSF